MNWMHLSLRLGVYQQFLYVVQADGAHLAAELPLDSETDNVALYPASAKAGPAVQVSFSALLATKRASLKSTGVTDFADICEGPQAEITFTFDRICQASK